MISSITNQKVKNWRKLHKRKGRNEANAYLIEGTHLVEEAWKSGANIKELIVEENTTIPEWCQNIAMEIVNSQVFQHISQTVTPQGIAAVIMKDEKQIASGNKLILIDAIQDPGNLGTIIRTADAAGIDGVILGKGTVDVYNDKVIRATQGSLFHIPIYEADLAEEIALLREQHFDIWVTALEAAEVYTAVSVPEKVAIILGNEGSGVDPSIIELADRRVIIPIYGKAESLNVSVAAGVLMYHVKG